MPVICIVLDSENAVRTVLNNIPRQDAPIVISDRDGERAADRLRDWWRRMRTGVVPTAAATPVTPSQSPPLPALTFAESESRDFPPLTRLSPAGEVEPIEPGPGQVALVFNDYGGEG